MSLKPTKKSDRGKSWMQPRRDKARSIQPEYHLIITEGTKTEPFYFKAIKERINQKYRNRIHMDICGEGCHTVALVEAAQEKARKNPNGYSHVWIVFDTDDFSADQIDQTVQRCAQLSTAQTRYHAIWSNQCVELWFLLHFGYFHSDIDRSEYWPKLSRHLQSINKGVYKKNREDMFEVLFPYLDDAIRNAKRLAEDNSGKPASKSAPGTRIYELIEALRPYL